MLVLALTDLRVGLLQSCSHTLSPGCCTSPPTGLQAVGKVRGAAAVAHAVRLLRRQETSVAAVLRDQLLNTGRLQGAVWAPWIHVLDSWGFRFLGF